MKLKFKRVVFVSLTMTGAVLSWQSPALSHAFPQQEQPGVGAVVHEAPKQIRIWFDARIEPVFSTIVVKDNQGKEVSGDSKVDPDTRQILETGLQPLPPGEYHVYWKVVAWDGHRTEGDYTFSISPQP